MESNDKQGIQSIEMGVKILQLVAAEEKPISITKLAELCETSKSKLYRYLNSFVRTGMLEKDENAKYILGREILRLGLKAYNSIEIVDIAKPYLIRLKEKYNETSAFALFGDDGPFFASWEESAGPINIGIKVGSKIGITDSATGKVFANYLPGKAMDELIKHELGNDPQAINNFKVMLEKERELGYSWTDGTIVQGISAIAAPVFNANSEIFGVITIVGLSSSINTAPDSEIVIELKECGVQISKEIGWTGF